MKYADNKLSAVIAGAQDYFLKTNKTKTMKVENRIHQYKQDVFNLIDILEVSADYKYSLKNGIDAIILNAERQIRGLEESLETQNPAKQFVSEVNRQYPGTFPDEINALRQGNNLPHGHSGE